MKNLKPTFTIGIPAFNEELNIVNLLNDIKNQKFNSAKLIKLILVSDSSTDLTISKAKTVKGLPLFIHKNKIRSGIGHSLNYIFKNSKTSIVITLDADIRLPTPDILEKLLSPLVSGNIDYVSSSIRENKAKSFFSSCLLLAMQIKRNIFLNFQNGNNIYTSYGLARGFSSRIYKQLIFPTSIGNDMYAYLFTINNNLNFKHIADSIVTYSLPQTLLDSSSQSQRYFQAKHSMGRYFDKKIVTASLRLPMISIIKGLIQSLPIITQKPFHLMYYTCYLLFVRISSSITKSEEKWQIATTTKHE